MAEQIDEELQENWVRGLFPAKFSAKDVFENGKVMSMETRRDEGIYSEIYKNVLLGNHGNAADVSSHIWKCHEPVQSDCRQRIPGNSHQDHIWTADDVSTIIKSYEHLKKKAVKLICIVETKSIKVRLLKAKLHEASMNLERVQAERNDLQKTNAQLETTVSKFERVVTEQEKQRNRLQSQVNFQTTQIVDLKKKLGDATVDITKRSELICKVESQLQLSKQQHEKESLKEIEQINCKHESRISELEASVRNLTEKLAIYKDKCCAAEKSLKTLQLHFESRKPGGIAYPKQQNLLSDFIDVVDFT